MDDFSYKHPDTPAADALHNANQLNKQIIQGAHEGIIVYDRDLRYLAWNPFMERITGVLAEDILGRHPAEAFPFLMDVGMLGRLERALAGEHPGTFDFPYFVPETGRSGWAMDTSNPLTNAAGEIIGVIATVSEITERKEAERALGKSEEKYRLLFESAGDAIFIHDGDGRMLEVNPQAVTQLGYSREELLSLPLERVDDQEESRHIPERMAILMEHGMHRFETVHRHKDGSRIPTEVSLRRIVWDDKPAILSVCRDIGNLKRAEELLAGANAELEAKVAERTSELSAANAALTSEIAERKRTEEELQSAKKAAEAASRAKSAFLANISHEIRTPMNGIIGMAQILEFTELDTKQKEYLHDIQVSSQSLLSLINDVLDLSKIEAGRIELERTAFSLRGNISELLRTQVPQIQAKGLTIKIDIPSEIPDGITGDQFRLKQLLINLVGNAVKFTVEGGITLSVAMVVRYDDIALLRFSVTDTGIGITPEVLAKIFEPFTQADASTTRKFGGTGLGLTICTRLVELMGGKIEVESEAGAGSTFHVVIPFVVNDLKNETPVSGESPQPPAQEGNPLNLLLVEDNEINRKFLTELLRREGHSVDTAENGGDALARWEQGRYDVILMDVQMPVMDGLEATRIIRAREEGAGCRVPIIALTARAMQDDREELLRQGFDGYVTKPMKIEALNEEIRGCLKG